MNRRDCFKKSSAAAALGLVSRAPLFSQAAPSAPNSPAAQTPPVTEFKVLRGDVGYFTGRGGTIGWLASKDALLVVDTQFPDTGALCLAGLPGRGNRSVDLVVNTHHHADHTSGNIVFKPATKTIVAHANVPKLQFAAAEKAATLDKQVYADTTFTDAWRHDLGSEVISAQYFAPAHTKGDIAVTFA